MIPTVTTNSASSGPSVVPHFLGLSVLAVLTMLADVLPHGFPPNERFSARAALTCDSPAG